MASLTTTELTVAVKTTPNPGRTTFEKHQQYLTKLHALEATWATWLGETYASNFSLRIRDEIYEKAWSDSASRFNLDYYKVEAKYRELSKFADLVAGEIHDDHAQR
jgi:hypothetical protein